MISLPLILFIDDFGIHRNMYRALKAFYWIPANLDYSNRRKIANVYTLSLGPHGADIADVVSSLKGPLQRLARGVWMELKGVKRFVCAFTLMIIGDMPQQADNSGFMRHSARIGCRSCFIAKENRHDLHYDIIHNGRYHYQILADREEAGNLDGVTLQRFMRERGMRLNPSPIVELAPALDLVLSRPYDTPHSEWRGLGRLLQSLLFEAILTKNGGLAYLKAFQGYLFPPGWARIQSPMYYIWSWSLSEAGRASILLPLILRSHARVGWFRLPFLQAVRRQFRNDERTLTPMQWIIHSYGVIAEANTIVGSQGYSNPDTIERWMIQSRECFQTLMICANAAR